MKSSLTLEVTWTDEQRGLTVGVLGSTDGVIDICRASKLGPFDGPDAVVKLFSELVRSWAAPSLGTCASESLHDTWQSLAG